MVLLRRGGGVSDASLLLAFSFAFLLASLATAPPLLLSRIIVVAALLVRVQNWVEHFYAYGSLVRWRCLWNLSVLPATRSGERCSS